jgi:hypothetical protein
MSLGGLGQRLSAVERHGDAAAVAGEGLAAIVPFAERHAQAFVGLARTLGQIYRTACENAGIEPDMALLERGARALGAGGSAANEGAEDAGD